MPPKPQSHAARSPINKSNNARVKNSHVSRHGKRVHLRYDYPHRLYSSKVYPYQSPRGSEIIVSGYDDGLYIVWRGGKPLKITSRKIKNNTNDTLTEWNGGVSIKEIDEQSGKPMVTKGINHKDRVSFEDEDEELEEEEANLPLIQELKLSLGSPVLHLVVPTVPTSPTPSNSSFDPNVPVILQTNIVVVATCADGSVRVIALPLTPPSVRAKHKHTLAAHICQLSPPASGNRIPRAVALSWTPASGDGPASASAQPHDLLVALSASGITDTLTFYRLAVNIDSNTGLKLDEVVKSFHSVQLSGAANHICFNPSQSPSPRHSQLVVADLRGSVRVYDPFASDISRSRPSSSDSAAPDPIPTGAWVASFDTPFHVPKDTASNYPGLARRKPVLDARWVLGGSSILVLLSDGEWGVWSVHEAAPKSLPSGIKTRSSSFVIRGFVGDASKFEATTAPETKSRTSQRLAPMTPNTRKVRQESLFSGPTTATIATDSSKGGISAAATTTSHGAPEDSIVLWYGGEAYHIPSLASLWQRSVSSSGRDMGSLYGPGLVRIEGLDLAGEILNDVEQFPARRTAVSAGSITHRDILVTAEYRTVIVAATRPQTPSRSLFAREAGSPSTSFDLQLLEKGELDLGGMDRLLDGMTGISHTSGFGKPKRVGFAR